MHRRKFGVAACVMDCNLNRLTNSSIQKSAMHSTTERKAFERNLRKLAVLMNGVNRSKSVRKGFTIGADFHIQSGSDGNGFCMTAYADEMPEQRF